MSPAAGRRTAGTEGSGTGTTRRDRCSGPSSVPGTGRRRRASNRRLAALVRPARRPGPEDHRHVPCQIASSDPRSKNPASEATLPCARLIAVDLSFIASILIAATTAGASTLTVMLGVYQLTSGMRLRGAQASLASALGNAQHPNQRRLLRALHDDVAGGVVARRLVPWTGFVIPVVAMATLLAATVALGAMQGRFPIPHRWFIQEIFQVLAMGFFIGLAITKMIQLSLTRVELADAFSSGLDLSTVQEPSGKHFVWWSWAAGICLVVLSYNIAFQVALPHDDPFGDPYTASSWSEYRSEVSIAATIFSAVSGGVLLIVLFFLSLVRFEKRGLSSARIERTYIDTDDSELRAWAQGNYQLEAGVELLIRTGFADQGRPWVQELSDDPGHYWVDANQITADTIGIYSSGEQRILRIAAALMNGQPVSLHEAVPGLDRDHLALVLAAIAHAGDSRERPLGSLYPWPEISTASEGGKKSSKKH